MGVEKGKIISGTEAAKILGVSRAFLYKLMEEGRLHRVDAINHLKAKNPLRFYEDEVLKLHKKEQSVDDNPKPAETPAA